MKRPHSNIPISRIRRVINLVFIKQSTYQFFKYGFQITSFQESSREA